MTIWRLLCLSVSLLLAWPLQAELVDVPPMQQRVTDLTGTLNAGQRATLENRLQSFESSKGSQIAVLMVASTQPEAIEQYALRVAEQWQIGRKSVDDGVLLLIAKQDRKLRIEVGYGLEGAITDADAKRIIAETITPLFKQNDYFGGISAGVDSLMGLINGEALPPPQAINADNRMGIFLMLWFAVTLLVSNLFNRLLGALLSAALAGCLAWILFTTVTSAAIAAGVAFVIALIFPELMAGLSNQGHGGYYGNNRGGWSGGSSSWRGGGGGFGGGGASGDW